MLRIKNYEYMNSIGAYNDKYPKSKVGDYVRISIYRNIFCRNLHHKMVKKGFLIRNVEINAPWTY